MAAKTGQKKSKKSLDTNFFGTKSEMVKKRVEKDGAIIVVAEDQKGLYLTEERFIDAIFADPNRYGERQEIPQEYLDAEDA